MITETRSIRNTCLLEIVKLYDQPSDETVSWCWGDPQDREKMFPERQKWLRPRTLVTALRYLLAEKWVWDPLVAPLSIIKQCVTHFAIFLVVRIPTSLSPVNDCMESRRTCWRDNNVAPVKITMRQFNSRMIWQRWPPRILILWAVRYQIPRQLRKLAMKKFDVGKGLTGRQESKDFVLTSLAVNRRRKS